jgi:hypothetical protein
MGKHGATAAFQSLCYQLLSCGPLLVLVSLSRKWGQEQLPPWYHYHVKVLCAFTVLCQGTSPCLTLSSLPHWCKHVH